jgi:hypothetical protein
MASLLLTSILLTIFLCKLLYAALKSLPLVGFWEKAFELTMSEELDDEECGLI